MKAWEPGRPVRVGGDSPGAPFSMDVHHGSPFDSVLVSKLSSSASRRAGFPGLSPGGQLTLRLCFHPHSYGPQTLFCSKDLHECIGG